MVMDGDGKIDEIVRGIVRLKNELFKQTNWQKMKLRCTVISPPPRSPHRRRGICITDPAKPRIVISATESDVLAVCYPRHKQPKKWRTLRGIERRGDAT